jgi:hypothetical protein
MADPSAGSLNANMGARWPSARSLSARDRDLAGDLHRRTRERSSPEQKPNPKTGAPALGVGVVSAVVRRATSSRTASGAALHGGDNAAARSAATASTGTSRNSPQARVHVFSAMIRRPTGRERSDFDLRPLGLEDLRGDASVVNVMGQIAVQVRAAADEPGWLACSVSDGAMPKIRARSP